MGLSHSPTIVMDGILLSLDAANSRSYSGSGTTINNLTGSISGSMVNGVGFSSLNSGLFSFDGTNDAVILTSNPSLGNQITVSVWVKLSDNTNFGWILGRENSYRILYTTSIFLWDVATTNNGWYTAGKPASAFIKFSVYPVDNKFPEILPPVVCNEPFTYSLKLEPLYVPTTFHQLSITEIEFEVICVPAVYQPLFAVATSQRNMLVV